MLWTVMVAACLATLLPPATCYSPRLQWLDSEEQPTPDLGDEPSWNLDDTPELGDVAGGGNPLFWRWQHYSENRGPSGNSNRDYQTSKFLPQGAGIFSDSQRAPERRTRWGRRR